LISRVCRLLCPTFPTLESQGLFIYMDIEKIKQHNNIIIELERDYGDAYYYLLGKCIMQGMDIETAIYYCWNKLKKETK
jgi:hypothetical protein